MSTAQQEMFIPVIIIVVLAAILNFTIFAPEKKEENKSISDFKIQIENEIIEVEIADTVAKRAEGLMLRKYLLQNHGMLFVYKEPDILSFWMKNTLIPLSIAFIDENGIIIDIQDMESYAGQSDESLPVYKSKSPALYALEMSQGWFKEKKIEPGMKVLRLPK